MAPMEEASRNFHNASTLLFLGGGMYIGGGTVTIQGTSIYSNTAVTACFLNLPGTFFHGLDGRNFLKMLPILLTLIHGPDGRNFQEGSLCKHLSRLIGICELLWNSTPTFIIHRPDGRCKHLNY